MLSSIAGKELASTGLVPAWLLVSKGLTSEAAVKSLSGARGNPVPETAEQRRWIDRYAAVLTGPR
ncbi:MAG TPA: hypothetical protein VN946_14325 [Terriglobales bacterium]|jgi:hypothetical protein|nr:hypothetical protein [Terriglobales bacterium]